MGTPPCLLLAWPCHVFPPQTFVNDVRIPDQKYVPLKLHDAVRFGYDILSWPCSSLGRRPPSASVTLLSRRSWGPRARDSRECDPSPWPPDRLPDHRNLLLASWPEFTQSPRNK